MGFLTLSVNLPTHFTDEELKTRIGKQLNINDFSWQIQRKSLDARNKRFIHWKLNVAVFSPEIKGETKPEVRDLSIPFKQRDEKVTVVGSGPAGIFCALVLQKAGYSVCLLERGSEVNERSRAIHHFEKTGLFNAANNYSFGEGGAGTFSDGKLTSRSKHISIERQFILNTYIQAGAPPEIAYMAHPHLGTDNLRKMVKNMREAFVYEGGEIRFDTLLKNMAVKSGKVEGVYTSGVDMETDILILATGHSAFDTYRMLMKQGVPFRTKRFALGSRMEHPQELINKAQWGKPALPGLKAAEYRLSSAGDGTHQVYSFCMCPGGIVVPAAAFSNTNIVNGMSYYKRNGFFGNAACVAGIHPDELAGKTVAADEALDMLQAMEESFYNRMDGYQAPAIGIADFMQQKQPKTKLESSYPLGLKPAPLFDFLPKTLVNAMQAGLKDFAGKMHGFEQGILLGLESKTSSPIQVVREEGGLCSGFKNLYMIGEGSGYAGGIISSAADGVKTAMRLIQS